MLGSLLGLLLSAPIVSFLVRLSGRGKGSAAAARRLAKFENLQNVMVPFRLAGKEVGVRVDFFEIGLLKGYKKPRFGWWDEVMMGDFGSFLRTMDAVNLEPDGRVKGVCRIKDGRSVHVSAQRDDLEILKKYFTP